MGELRHRREGEECPVPALLNSCQFFVFKHSPEYQKVQHQFYSCVKTFRPESIGVSLDNMYCELIASYS